MPRQDDDVDFLCWRYWVGLGDAACTQVRCPFFSTRSPCYCELNDPTRQHGVAEIAVRMNADPTDVQAGITAGLVKGRRSVLVRDMADGLE